MRRFLTIRLIYTCEIQSPRPLGGHYGVRAVGPNGLRTGGSQDFSGDSAQSRKSFALYVGFGLRRRGTKRIINTIVDETEINAGHRHQGRVRTELRADRSVAAEKRRAWRHDSASQGTARYAARAQNSRDRADRRVQGFGDRARASRMDDPQSGRTVARQKGLTWVNPYHHELWDYNIHVAEDAVKLGFGEVQFDYVNSPNRTNRFRRRSFQIRTGRTKNRRSPIFSQRRIRDCRNSACTTTDMLGLVTLRSNALGPASSGNISRRSRILPMTYPSLSPRLAEHRASNAERHAMFTRSIAHGAVNRPDRRACRACAGVHRTARIRAGSASRAEAGGVRAGASGWVMWNPGSVRTAAFLMACAFERNSWWFCSVVVSFTLPEDEGAANRRQERQTTGSSRSSSVAGILSSRRRFGEEALFL